MKLEIETGSYNDRRYSKPWIAKVDFRTNSKGDYAWGEWVGQLGESGILVIDVEPGDIVARGQKDLRKPRNSAPDFYVVTDEGNLRALSTKAEAYKLQKSNKEENKQ